MKDLQVMRQTLIHVLWLSVWMKHLTVTIPLKATVQYSSVVLFNVLIKVVQNLFCLCCAIFCTTENSS